MVKAKNVGKVWSPDGVPYNYIVIIDAGSSGSRVHIYSYPDTKEASRRKHATLEGRDVSSTGSDGSDGHKDEQELDQAEQGDSYDIPSPSNSTLPFITKQGHKWWKKQTPGISTFAATPSKVGEDHLKPLLKYAQGMVPQSQQYRTPIFLYATGGVRMLRPTVSTNLLTSACNYIRTYTDFFLPECSSYVSMIDGEVEGIFGWTAVNYLAGNLQDPIANDHGKSHFTYGFLDMGGASTQVTFVPNTTETQEHKQNMYTVNIPSLNGNEDLSFQVSSTSYLRYGVNEVHKQILDLFVESGQDPCSPKGLITIYDVSNQQIIALKSSIEDDNEINTDGEDTDKEENDDKRNKKRKKNSKREHKLRARGSIVELRGTGNFEQCQSAMVPLVSSMRNGNSPDFDFDINHFIGVSEYWDVTYKAFQLNGGFNLSQLQSRVEEFCGTDWGTIENDKHHGKYADLDYYQLDSLCLRATWVLTVVKYGLEIPAGVAQTSSGSSEEGPSEFVNFGNTLQSMDKFNGTKYSWTLGRAVLYASGEQSNSTRASQAGLLPNYNIGSKSFLFGVPLVARPPFQPWHAGEAASLENFMNEHKHRLWGSLVFLFILVIILYLLLGRMRRRQIWHSVRTYVPFAGNSEIQTGSGLNPKKFSFGILVGSWLSKLPFLTGPPSPQASSNFRKYQRMNQEPVEDLELGTIDESLGDETTIGNEDAFSISSEEEGNDEGLTEHTNVHESERTSTEAENTI